jgi:hypothetical protein
MFWGRLLDPKYYIETAMPPSMFSLVILDTWEEFKVATLIRIHKSIASLIPSKFSHGYNLNISMYYMNYYQMLQIGDMTTTYSFTLSNNFTIVCVVLIPPV